MVKVFEDLFSRLQADMVATCLEYVENKADDIYIYCSYEPEAYYFNVFYKVKSVVVLKHQLNEKKLNFNYTYDTSTERQVAVQRIGVENLEEIHELCQAFQRDMPTEMKLHFDVKTNGLQAKYRYDLVYSNDEVLLPSDVFNSWFEEIKSKNA